MADHVSLDIINDPAFRLAYLSVLLTNKNAGRAVSETAVLNEMMRINDFSAPGSLISRVMQSACFIATVEGVDFEESSQRYVVTLSSQGGTDRETIRTDRVDGKYGNYVKSFWGRGTLVGRRCLIYKFHENADADGKARRGYRVCPYARVLS